MAVDREILFGTDLDLADRGGAMDLASDQRGDLALAQGNENIIQALTMRLLVRKGELARLGWPNYGSRIHELIGEPNNQRTRTILMAHARSAIEQDARVEKVDSVVARVLQGERDVVRLELEIELIHDQKPLNLVFDVRLGVA
jgi:phage baseplate assembly protein W